MLVLVLRSFPESYLFKPGHPEPVEGSVRSVRRRNSRWLNLLAAVAILLGPLSASADTVKEKPTSSSTLAVISAYGINGVVLWLSADYGVTKDADGNVAALADHTGNFLLKTTDPDGAPEFVSSALNGAPVLRFNAYQALYSPEDFGPALNGEMTLIVVARTSGVRTRLQYPIYLGQNGSSHANRALAYADGNEIFDGQWVSFVGPPLVRKNYVMSAVTVDPSVSHAAFYRDGTLVKSVELDKHATFAALSNGVTLGAAANPCRFWLGEIAEVLVFDRQLSAPEVQTIWVFLSNKYGLKPVIGDG